MGKYRLTANAEADLIRIHQWGVRTHGETRADAYYFAFFDHFDELARQPLLFPAVDDIREGYRRSLCGVDSVYYRIVFDTVEIMAIIGKQDIGKWI